MKKSHRIFILIFILLLASGLRLIHLDSIPNGLYQDETAIGYNAYSLLETGKDEHGQTLPLYFKSFGDWKLPVYIYTTVASVFFFDLNAFSVRLPSALFGILTVAAVYIFISYISRNKLLGMLSAFLLAINPWHIHYSRATFEVSIALFLFVFGSHLIHIAFGKKKPLFLYIGTVLFILGMYSYNLTRLLAPVLYLLTLRFAYASSRIKSHHYVANSILSFVLLIPFALTLFASGGASSASGTLIFSSASVQAALLEFRSYLTTLPTLINKIFFNTIAMTVWRYIENLASYLSIPFFYISGSSHGNHGIGVMGLFYLSELPFFLYGIYASLRKRTSWMNYLILWAISTIAIAALTRESPHATRSYFLLLWFIPTTAFGMIQFHANLSRLTVRRRIVSYVFIIGLFIFNYIYFFGTYVMRFPVAYAGSWRSADKELSVYLAENEYKYDNILIDEHSGFMYTSLLFYSKYPPIDFQEKAIFSDDDSEGFSFPKSFGKYSFTPINWDEDTSKSRTLIITTKDIALSHNVFGKEFSLPSRPVVVAVKQDIVSYPEEKVVYVAIESH